MKMTAKKQDTADLANRKRRGAACARELLAFLKKSGLEPLQDVKNSAAWDGADAETALLSEGIPVYDPRVQVDLRALIGYMTFEGRLLSAIYWDATGFLETLAAEGTAWLCEDERTEPPFAPRCLIPGFWPKPEAPTRDHGSGYFGRGEPDAETMLKMLENAPVISHGSIAMEAQRRERQVAGERLAIWKRILWSFVVFWWESARTLADAAETPEAERPKRKVNKERRYETWTYEVRSTVLWFQDEKPTTTNLNRHLKVIVKKRRDQGKPYSEEQISKLRERLEKVRQDALNHRGKFQSG